MDMHHLTQMTRCQVLKVLLLCWWACNVTGHRPRFKRPLPTLKAWEAFNEYLRVTVPAKAVASFKEVCDPEADGFREHDLNLRTAKELQQKMTDLLKEDNPIYLGVLLWDAVAPAEYQLGITQDLGVVEYTECSHSPEDVFDDANEVIMRPCKEGGSVYTFARSGKFSWAETNPDTTLSTPGWRRREKTKRVMIFYTPHDVWSLFAFPDLKNIEGPSADGLVKIFEEIIHECASKLTSAKSIRKMNLVVPEILAEVESYSAPGESSPFGFIIEVPVKLPAAVRQHLAGDMKLHIIANVPVVVSSYDCQGSLWCD